MLYPVHCRVVIGLVGFSVLTDRLAMRAWLELKSRMAQPETRWTGL